MTERAYDYYGASGALDKVEAYLFDGTYILVLLSAGGREQID